MGIQVTPRSAEKLCCLISGLPDPICLCNLLRHSFREKIDLEKIEIEKIDIEKIDTGKIDLEMFLGQDMIIIIQIEFSLK